MARERTALSLRVHDEIAAIDPADWDACAGADNPFIGHAFLSALEDSGSAASDSGWLPQHLALEDAAGRVVGVVPCYLKSHSYGEYVFDWGWAEAFERAGGKYYPKLQTSVPFSPVTGHRLLVRPDADRATVSAALIGGLVELAGRRKVSSVHITFPTEGEWRTLGDAGFLQRVGQQFHWENRGYADFDGFLAALASRKRKMLRKEREVANAQGVVIETLSGDALSEAHMERFYRFYLNTVDRKWASAYLTRAFFTLLRERLADKVVLMMARRGTNWIAGALNLRGGDTLYGRNWGCSEDVPMLHFEMCYYRALDYAIAHGLKRVEAGAQGPHKIQRGYLPSRTYSAHWIRDPRFREAVAGFLAQETRRVAFEMDRLGERSPFRNADGESEGESDDAA
ncbi:MAG: N-acetyltransferase [Alphaproteobacteria bacterium]|nr:N-acetyltransferase [Alphaproteobacteria bacterium]